MMPRMPFSPVEAGYSVQPGDSTQRIQLDGGSGRYRTGVSDNSHQVDATWALFDADYDAFMGFVRLWKRSGGQPFKVALPLDGSIAEDYDACFVPGSIQLTSKNGPVFLVSARLEVFALAKYEDAETDPYATAYELLPYYGSFAAIQDMMNRLEKLVNRDWPHA